MVTYDVTSITYNNESNIKSCELYSNSPRALNNVGNYIHDSALFKCMFQIRSGKTNI